MRQDDDQFHHAIMFFIYLLCKHEEYMAAGYNVHVLQPELNFIVKRTILCFEEAKLFVTIAFIIEKHKKYL